jgi:hypothetical protein
MPDSLFGVVLRATETISLMITDHWFLEQAKLTPTPRSQFRSFRQSGNAVYFTAT